jgi:hypothetical protein
VVPRSLLGLHRLRCDPRGLPSAHAAALSPARRDHLRGLRSRSAPLFDSGRSRAVARARPSSLGLHSRTCLAACPAIGGRPVLADLTDTRSRRPSIDTPRCVHSHRPRSRGSDFGDEGTTLATCSVLVVSHHLDGFLRIRCLRTRALARAVLHPRSRACCIPLPILGFGVFPAPTDSYTRLWNRCPSRSERSPRRAIPLEGAPSCPAVPRRRGPVPP